MDLREEIASMVAEDGWTSIIELVNLVPYDVLLKEYGFLLDEDE